MQQVNRLCYMVMLLFCCACSNQTDVAHADLDDVQYEVSAKNKDVQSGAHKDVQWFLIKIKAAQNSNQSVMRYNKTNEQYQILLDYYLNYAQKDIQLKWNNTSLEPISYWFENNHNIVGYDMINVGFDVSTLDCDDCKVQLSFNDRNFSNGIVQFPVEFKK